MGLRSLRHGNAHLAFASPVDIQYSTTTREGAIYAQGTIQPAETAGFALGPSLPVGNQGWKTHNTHYATFSNTQHAAADVGGKA
jgi:hypothetical protein